MTFWIWFAKSGFSPAQTDKSLYYQTGLIIDFTLPQTLRRRRKYSRQGSMGGKRREDREWTGREAGRRGKEVR